MPSKEAGLRRSPHAPPAAPWEQHIPQEGAGAYLSVYLSSDIARLPVRDITRLGDNKSDPNLETQTYGLFSTCEPAMRTSIANRGIREIFFMTRFRDRGRVLVGRYEIGWIVRVEEGDVAMAAQSARFVDPIPVGAITGAAGKAVQTRMRAYMRVDDDVADALRGLIDSRRDRTADYVSEIHRLERMSFSRTGYSYPSWDRIDPFTWDSAAEYLANLSAAPAGPNTSASGLWVCTECRTQVRNRSRLKICNACKRRGTLEPAGDQG